MKTKSTPAKKNFRSATSRNRESGVTLRLLVARDHQHLLEMGERIKELRALHGYKQQWIADQVGVTLRSYQFWQEGKSPPGQENLEKLAKLFGVEPKYILHGETPDLLETLEPQKIQEQLDRIEETMESLAEQLETVKQLTDLLSRARILDALDQLAAREETMPARTRAPSTNRR